jgi:hypothetical protein
MIGPEPIIKTDFMEVSFGMGFFYSTQQDAVCLKTGRWFANFKVSKLLRPDSYRERAHPTIRGFSVGVQR